MRRSASTNCYYHTLGYTNDSSENWDYLAFNDRDFSSVAELMLVPGCPPGLFTKQFVEFAPSQMNAANIFSTVTPVITPTFGGLAVTAPAAPTSSPLAAFTTATLPFLSVSQATAKSSLGSSATGALPQTVPSFPSASLTLTQPSTGIVTPVQPHTFPYLVDKFFYSGASTFLYPPLVGPDPMQNPNFVLGGAGTTDPSWGPLRYTSNVPAPVVGGPAADGWFKMFDFFEVPSQMIGAIGTVAQGNNFDWARQDTKPGLMNLNLIIDEEAFFSVFGDQTSSYSQNLLNSIELPLLAVANGTQLTLPYGMPLATNNNGSPPIPYGGPPVPLVVSAIQPNGAPNYVYPVTDQTQYLQHGFLTSDPIFQAFVTADGLLTPDTLAPLPAVGNRIKAAFAQFLSLRHGGSGYLFGYGGGVTGQNQRGGDSARPGLQPADPAAGPGRAPLPLAVVPGHQLHDHAAGGAAAFGSVLYVVRRHHPRQ